jgi:hypothetical protein
MLDRFTRSKPEVFKKRHLQQPHAALAASADRRHRTVAIAPPRHHNAAPPNLFDAVAKTDATGDGATAALERREPANRSGFKTIPVG